MRSIIAALVAASCLVGCTAQNTDQAEVALTAAEKAATNYIKLPLCTGANGPVCSQATISAQIKTADAAAYAAFKTWQSSPTATNSQALTAALSALVAAIPAIISQ